MAVNRLYKDLELSSFDEETIENYAFPEDNSTVERWIHYNTDAVDNQWSYKKWGVGLVGGW